MFNFNTQRETHISVDCIKVCPYRKGLVALAYYQTNPTTQGAISVTQINEGKDIHEIVPLECPPLLHLVWSKRLGNEEQYVLAAATRTDDVYLFGYSWVDKKLSLLKVIRVGQGIFCLYLDMMSYNDYYHIVVSSNQSAVISLNLDHEFNISSKNTQTKHQYAVWTCRIDPHHQNNYVCGDQVNSIYLYSNNQLISKNNHSHQGGICDLTFGQENQIFSGGFDGVVCSYDTRKLKDHVERYDWGGTIWRVVPDHQQKRILLCNSSEKKFQIVDRTLSKQLWNSGDRHDSLAYAGDWLTGGLLTASFYDKKLCYWSNGIPESE